MRHKYDTRRPRGRVPAGSRMLTSYPPARSRGSVVARKTWSQRRRSRLTRTVVVILLLVLAAAAFAWKWTRPVRLTLTASPSDAVVSLSTGQSARGTLDLEEMPSGTYSVTVSRKGFATRTVSVDAPRMRDTSANVKLEPLPQKLSITADPPGASIKVVGAGPAKEARRKLAASLPSGAYTIEIAANGRNPWKKELFLDAPTKLSVRLDPEGQVVHSLALATCSGAPKAVALTPDGREAWATILDGPPSIEIFEPSTGKRVGEVDIGKHGAVEIVFNLDGTLAYASQMETARVFEIDVKRRKVLRDFDTESAWTKVVALSPDEKTLYAANWSGDDVSEIDLETGELRRRIPVADTPRGLWPSADGKTLWVASFGVGDLERVDLKTGKVKRVFTSGGALRHLVADEKAQKLYASDMARDCVWVTDMRTGKTKLFTKVDHKPNTIDLSPDGKVLFVSCRGENNSISYYLPGPEWGSILLYATDGARPLDAIVGGNQCTALDASADGRTLVFSDFLDNRLRSYEVPDYATLSAGLGGRFAVYRGELAK